MPQYRIIYFNKLESTNKYALDNILQLDDKTIIRARTQTNGYGRFKRKWISDDYDNLYFSIVLKPSENLDNTLPLPNLTQYMSVIIAELIEKYGLTPEIKWPNDVKINRKKVSGILSETSIRGNKLNGIVIGVGINLNTKRDVLSKIDQPATSISLELKKETDTDIFLRSLLNAFFDEYDTFMENGFNLIKERYTSKCTFLGKEILIKNFDKEQRATAAQINNDGSLLIDDKGHKSVVLVGDILC